MTSDQPDLPEQPDPPIQDDLPAQDDLPIQPDLPATPALLRTLTREGYLSAAALERAYALSGHTPDQAAWHSFISRVLLLLGVALALSGVVFFFAYNWAGLHHLVKLGLVQAAIVAAVGLAHARGLRSLVGQVALLGAAVLVGVLLAVYGQAYQTGADSFQLFVTWAVLIGGWVLVARFVPLWALLLLLLNLSLALYWQQRLLYTSAALAVALALLNGAWLLGWEYASTRGSAWLQSRWFPQLAGLATFALLTMPTLAYIFDWNDGSIWVLRLAALLYGGFSLLVIAYYRAAHDLPMLTMCAISVIVVLTAIAARLLGNDFNTYIVLSMLVIAQAALAANLLSRATKAWGSAV